MHIFQIFLALFVLQCLAAVIALADYFVWFVGLGVHKCQFTNQTSFDFGDPILYLNTNTIILFQNQDTEY